jgi:hypothetical protein
VVDPSATGFRVQLHHDGLPSVIADNAVLPGIRTLSSLFALTCSTSTSPATELLTELPGYSLGRQGRREGEDDQPIKVADHGIDAMRYATHSTRGTWRRRCARSYLAA